MSENEKGAYGQVLKYTGIFGGVQGLNVIVSLVRNKLAALLLGPAGMGLVSLFNSTVAFISQATGFGISMSAVRHISELTETGDEAQRAYYIKVVRAWSILAALLGVLVCVAIGPFLSSNTFAWGNHTVPAYYFFGQAGIVPVIVLMALVTYLFTVNYSYRFYPLHLKGSKGVLGEGMEMIRLGIAFTLAGIVGAGSEMLIRSWLNLQGDLDAVGLYNAGYMITVTYASMVFSAMEADYFPRLSAVNGNVTATNETVNKQMEVTMLIIAPMLVALIVLLPVLTPLLLSEKFMPIVAMTQVAALAMFFKAVTLPAAYITLARGYSLIYLALETAYFVVFVLLVMFGYRHWGLMGTGIAITVANVFDFLMIHAVARFCYHYKMSSAVMRYSAIHILIGLLAFFTTITVDGFSYWVFGIGLSLISLMFSLLILHQKTHLWAALMKRLPWLRKSSD